MTRAAVIARAQQLFDSDAFRETLARRIAMRIESQNPERSSVLAQYLHAEMQPAFESIGFSCRTLTHSKAKAPFLFAQRIEDQALPTVFGYGHGDVIRGLESEWKEGLSPWQLTERDGRWYGRGIADNKGQHSINMQAMANVLSERGELGFNARYLIEMGEETGSQGAQQHLHRSAWLAHRVGAALLPRLLAARPERTPAARVAARGLEHHDRPLLGLGRRRYAEGTRVSARHDRSTNTSRNADKPAP